MTATTIFNRFSSSPMSRVGDTAQPSNVQAQAKVDAAGLRLARQLDGAANSLPHDFAERLRAGRERALTLRKRGYAPAASAAAFNNGGGTLALGGDDRLSWLGRLGTVLPLVLLVVGLVSIEFVQSNNRAEELADIDQALLTDELPPAAYADPGFAQFIRNGR